VVSSLQVFLPKFHIYLKLKRKICSVHWMMPIQLYLKRFHDGHVGREQNLLTYNTSLQRTRMELWEMRIIKITKIEIWRTVPAHQQQSRFCGCIIVISLPLFVVNMLVEKKYHKEKRRRSVTRQQIGWFRSKYREIREYSCFAIRMQEIFGNNSNKSKSLSRRN